MKRQVILDTETTGIGHKQGHRIIEIGCVEMIDRQLTGNHYHVYIDPEREVDEGAFRVHGISNEFLADKPKFADVVNDFIAFVDGAELVIHNAPFDMGFLNHELMMWNAGFGQLEARCSVLDTLVMAREKHPGQKCNLDALCKRYAIDNTNRTLHGALLDAEILATVYLAMTGGQTHLFAADESSNKGNNSASTHNTIQRNLSSLKVVKATAEELEKHQAYVNLLLEKSEQNLWDQPIDVLLIQE